MSNNVKFFEIPCIKLSNHENYFDYFLLALKFVSSIGLVRKQLKILQSDKKSAKELKNKEKNTAVIKKLQRLQFFFD